ncbi:MAG TPA: ABC-type transport auxiliary lipoprotein family protein [Candidatus Cloacimonadota bacterium]|nr:ABC-type transport auxiliary lipoprotein family protein [Candidatus Cloacimonadota bacterium]
MKNYKNLIWLLWLAVIFISGCAAGELLTKNYYILEYYSHGENPNLVQKTPIPKSVYIQDAKVSKTYNRNQIVIRHFGPRITYDNYNLWGVKLTKVIPDLIQKRMQNYRLFKQINREFLDTRPDLEVSVAVNNIEEYISENMQQARVNISFILRNSGEATVLAQHSVNVERRLLSNDYDTFVQTVNEIILEETDKFIIKILRSCGVEGCTEEIPAEKKDKNILEEITAEDFTEEEEIEVGEGTGLLQLPALSRTDNEPLFYAINDSDFTQSGKMGTPLALQEGVYTIRYGSGKANQLMKQENIKIIPRYKTIIEPDWGCIIIEVMDKQRNYAKVRFDIYDLVTGESYGGGFPAEEEIGEQSTVWVLKPGIYKITLNNEPFNTYTNFTTIYAEKGEVKRLTIVMDTDEDDNPTDMIGAGVLEESFLETSLEKTKISSAIHCNVNVNSDNEEEENTTETTIIMDTQMENYLIYDDGPVHYTMKNLIELGTSKNTNEDFRLATDEFELKNTLVYYFFKDLGVYGRFDAKSHFFDGHWYSTEEFYCTKIDKDGNTVLDSVLVDHVKTESSFFPLTLKEGVGINYRIFNRSRANLNLRVGFGLEHIFNKDVYQLYSPSGNTTYREYHEIESENKKGTEASLVGSFQLPLNLSYNVNADFLFPFNDLANYSMEWENVLTAKLFKYISVDYKLKFIHEVPNVGDDYIAKNHTLFLRITYFLR